MTDVPPPAPGQPETAPRGETPPPPSPATTALAVAVHEVEQHVATGGWDGPVRVFALVATGRALVAEPALAGQLPPAVVALARQDPHHLTSVEQEHLPSAGDLEELLGRMAWPPTVDGAAVVVERVVLPPAAEAGLPDDPDAALAYLMAHPDRQDVRLAVGALRSGERWCAVRTRAQDDDASVAGGADLVPGLADAVAATLT